jgi:hypothetical protein
MTVFGKILVFVNLVFSLVVGGLVMMVYLTRANWEDAYKKSEASLVAARAEREQTLREKDDAKKEYETKLAALQKENKDLNANLDIARRELNTKADELAVFKKQDRKDGADVSVLQTGNAASREYAKDLEKKNDELHKEKQALIAVISDERRSRIQAQTDLNYYKARNLEVEEKMREVLRELNRKSGPAGTVASRKSGEENPPAENVGGQVISWDPESGLVKVSIGSDAGLAIGNTLKVFRLHPIPEQSKFLGTIEILSVRPHEAVGRPTKPLSYPLRNGDRVASRLLLGS